MILLVEDDLLVRSAISLSLADGGFEVIEAATADKALELLFGGTVVDLS